MKKLFSGAFSVPLFLLIIGVLVFQSEPKAAYAQSGFEIDEHFLQRVVGEDQVHYLQRQVHTKINFTDSVGEGYWPDNIGLQIDRVRFLKCSDPRCWSNAESQDEENIFSTGAEDFVKPHYKNIAFKKRF